MITSKETAARVSEAGERFVEALNRALLEVRASSSPPDYERFRRAVGLIVGEMEVELLRPLYKQHPELEPESMRSIGKDDS
jgi:hypothetical protein